MAAGNYALMVGATGIARTAGEALLRRHELEGETRVLLGRVWNVEGYRARAFDELQVKGW
ncbi:MAG: hypothetical protein QXO76_01955 [Thermoproteota archaeon]